MTDEEWEELGRDISNNTHLEALRLYDGALNVHKMSFLFRGLTRSSSINHLRLLNNGLSVAGMRSMVPFLQNSNKLTSLYLEDNNIQSEGFNVLFRALRDSSIELLSCITNGIESIEIDSDRIPRNLKALDLDDNRINADGCRGLVRLLQGGDSALKYIWLNDNRIDDEGVAILVDALKSNTSLKELILKGNDISMEGERLLLKLVNDVSSIRATLQSNHTLIYVSVIDFSSYESLDADDKIQKCIDMATRIKNQPRNNWQGEGDCFAP